MWRQLRDALNSTGRPIWLYTSPHSGTPGTPVAATGVSAPWHSSHPYAPPPDWDAETIRGLANSMMFQYVNLFDYWYGSHWGSPTSPPGGLITNIDAMVALQQRSGVAKGGSISGPGFWADAQQLEICNFGEQLNAFGGPNPVGMTLEEYRSHYSIWAMFASPMVLGVDLRGLEKRHPKCLAMIKNVALLAIARDSGATPGVLVSQTTNLSAPSVAQTRSSNIVEQIFARNLHDSGGGIAVCFFNRDEKPRRMNISWAALGLPSGPAKRTVRNVWTAESSEAVGGVDATVGKHEIALFRVKTDDDDVFLTESPGGLRAQLHRQGHRRLRFGDP